MKIIWLNPIVRGLYDIKLLESALSKKGFTSVDCKQDHVTAVRAKYLKLCDTTLLCVADTRCPLAVDYVKAIYFTDTLLFAPIEPILIHCAKELRATFPTAQLFITTPCASLKDMGNALNLPNTIFLTWNEFAYQQDIQLPKQHLDKSPIPPGFFEASGKKMLFVKKQSDD